MHSAYAGTSSQSLLTLYSRPDSLFCHKLYLIIHCITNSSVFSSHFCPMLMLLHYFTFKKNVNLNMLIHLDFEQTKTFRAHGQVQSLNMRKQIRNMRHKYQIPAQLSSLFSFGSQRSWKLSQQSLGRFRFLHRSPVKVILLLQKTLTLFYFIK